MGDALRLTETGLLLLALLVGAGAGGGAVVFRWLITSLTHLLTGTADYSDAGHVRQPARPVARRRTS